MPPCRPAAHPEPARDPDAPPSPTPGNPAAPEAGPENQTRPTRPRESKINVPFINQLSKPVSTAQTQTQAQGDQRMVERPYLRLFLFLLGGGGG